MTQRFLCIYPRKMKAHVHVKNWYTNVHNIQKVEITQCPLTDEWINKMWYVYTRDCYLTIKRNEILICATTWVNRENTLSEKSESRKTMEGMIPFIGSVQNRQICRNRK